MVGALTVVVVVVGACSSSGDEESGPTTTTEGRAPISIATPERDGDGGEDAEGGDEGGGSTTSAPPDDAADEKEPPVTGTWEGTYICNQGVTGLTLTIEAGSEGALTGTFEFYAVPENPDVPSGSFHLAGTYTGGELTLIGTDWIDRPGNYITVDLQADAPGITPDHITGTVTPSDGTPGCTTFTVTPA